MDPTPTPTTAHKPTPNGTHKRHPIRHPPPPPSLYRECLKNHAASLGGHALDGCGEFMPSPSSSPADPSSLTCAACGCHRNFHRRLHLFTNTTTDDDEDDEEVNNNNNEDHFADSHNDRSTSSPPPSAPHMLLALSTGVATAPARKRYRSKFSPEQKERMHELSESLGWRLQKRDDGLVEERCREIGVGKGVFKVWMHNNKHNFNKRRTSPDSNNNNANIDSIHHHDDDVNGLASTSS